MVHLVGLLSLTKWPSIGYRRMLKDVVEPTESYANCLPRGTCITARKVITSIEKFSFERWAAMLVNEIKYRTSNSRKGLLLNGRYRSHIGIKGLDILKAGGHVSQPTVLKRGCVDTSLGLTLTSDSICAPCTLVHDAQKRNRRDG